MGLKQDIDADIKKAMLAKEKDTLRALRAIKSLILLAESEKGNEGELSEDKETSLLMKAAKQRKDSAELYEQQNREDLMQNELLELEVIERYLPKQMGDDELQEAIKAIISEVGASSAADVGKVMGAAMKKLAGQADGKRISSTAKALLS